MRRKHVIAGLTAALIILAAGAFGAVDGNATAADTPDGCQALFDDFDYGGPTDPLIGQRGWTVRANSGGPGVRGATWRADNISFPTVDGTKGLQLQASTDGTGGGTSQAELYHQRKFFEGTYAARVKFADEPVDGPDGDHLVETFFTITPLDAPMDPDYGEIDFEYLPNGGWGERGPIFYETTWETYRAEPLARVNTHSDQRRSLAGWHDLVFTVADGHVKYYLDGTLVGDHSGDYYPETPMSIRFNLWFIDTAGHNGGSATYRQQVDYLYHVANETLTPDEVNGRVTAYRAAGTAYTDTVGKGDGSCPTAGPTQNPPSASPTTPPTAPSQPSTEPATPADPATPPAGSAGCGTASRWSTSATYQTGEEVWHERSAHGDPTGPRSGDGVHRWRARWWTQGSEPGWTDQWEDLGRCG